MTPLILRFACKWGNLPGYFVDVAALTLVAYTHTLLCGAISSLLTLYPKVNIYHNRGVLDLNNFSSSIQGCCGRDIRE